MKKSQHSLANFLKSHPSLIAILIPVLSGLILIVITLTSIKNPPTHTEAIISYFTHNLVATRFISIFIACVAIVIIFHILKKRKGLRISTITSLVVAIVLGILLTIHNNLGNTNMANLILAIRTLSEPGDVIYIAEPEPFYDAMPYDTKNSPIYTIMSDSKPLSTTKYHVYDDFATFSADHPNFWYVTTDVETKFTDLPLPADNLQIKNHILTSRYTALELAPANS